MGEIRLFHLADGQVERQQASLFPSEKDLEDLMEQHLYDFLAVHFLDRQFSTGSGIIDMLGIDDAGRPVIIEYKRGIEINAIEQGLGYLRWLLRNQETYKQHVIERLNSERARRICWTPRLLIVASDYRDYQVNAAQIVPNIELLRYRRFGEQSFMLDWVHGGVEETTTPTSGSLPVTSPKPEIPQSPVLPDLGEFWYRGWMSDEAWALFRELLAVAQTLGTVRLDGFETHLSFRRRTEADDRIRWPVFASVRPNITQGIRVDVLDRTQSAPLEAGFTSVNRYHRTIYIRSRVDLEKARPLLREAYERT